MSTIQDAQSAQAAASLFAPYGTKSTARNDVDEVVIVMFGSLNGWGRQAGDEGAERDGKQDE